MPKRYFVNKLLSATETNVPLEWNYWSGVLTEYTQLIENRVPPVPKNADGGLYVGTPGIAYLFYRLIKSPLTASHKNDFIKRGLKYITSAQPYVESQRARNATDFIGFILGPAGFQAIAAAFYTAAGDKAKADEHLNHFVHLNTYCSPLYPVSFGGNELFVGRAGYLAGVLWLQKELQKQILPVDTINEICHSIVQDGRKYASVHRSPMPLMYSYYDTEYIGAAHGISAILFVLLCCEDYLSKSPDAEQDIKKCVDSILSLQTENGNFPCALDEIDRRRRRDEEDQLVHWCHGAPGVVYMMAKASLRWKEDKYLKSCIKCGDVIWEKGLLKKGPGLCHGVAGNGYVFLLLYRLTADEKYVFRANTFAQFMTTSEFKREARTPDCPFSLYEGLAGTVCYILDLFTPKTAAFPFMDVF